MSFLVMYYIENTLNKLSMKYALIYSFKKTQPFCLLPLPWETYLKKC